jgi:predicted RNase H-like HicB family nuclease
MPQSTYAAMVHREGELFVAECSEVGTVSQGGTVAGAMANLREATELYLEEFPPVDRSWPFVIVFEALA